MCVCVCACVCVCVLFLCVCFVCLFWGPFYVVINSPVNMPDSIRKHFGYRQLWPLQPAGSQIQAGSYIYNKLLIIICQIQLPASNLDLFFHRRPGSYCTKLAQIWSGWPGLLLLLDSTAFFHIQPGSYSAKPAQIQFGSADCVRFWPKVSGLEASQSARIIGLASGQWFRANLENSSIDRYLPPPWST